ncbi:Mut7-C RNAse domain-containing protein [Nitriliruptor alkaliphilus]|uniref:Mut7-C RNAse domain-containing protein n=1 Tax=Nitriliruptor alkaliphilus TaxID=427918 RepID=UPI00069669DB|nr:Mut7-C RNAse domain-containing protein [Nitriliruptor alkaliphilus]
MPAVTLRLYADLAELAGNAHHLVPVPEPRSIKDLVESVGVPHVEVALLLCDGVPVTFDHRLQGGERVSALPALQHLGHEGVPLAAPPAPAEPRFVCDVHLGTLARRLRLLGLDTRYDRSWDDAVLAGVAAHEDRVLLSRDRGLLKRRSVAHGYLPRSDDPDTQATEVVHRFGLGPHLAPSTRCVRCNGVLAPVDREEVWDRIPPRTRAAIDRYARCTGCDRLYWPGSHHDALAPFVERARAAAAGRHPVSGQRQ